VNPLIGVALALLPDLNKVIFGKDPQATKTVLDAVEKIIKDATQTDDPAKAKQALAADPGLEAETRIKLARIVADEDEKKSAAVTALIAAEQQKRKDELEALKVHLEDDGKKRDAEFARFRTALEDVGNARATFVGLASASNPMAWGAPAVSVIITIGFFGALGFLLVAMANGKTGAVAGTAPVFQIVNICIGALAAGFATVTSFWLGSSEGSRLKDVAGIQNQETQARQANKAIELQKQQNVEILRQRGFAPDERLSDVAKSGTSQKSKFERCLDIVLRQVNSPNQPAPDGGASNFGITRTTLAHWRKQEVSPEELAALTKDEATEIYRSNYWNTLNCESLPPGVDLLVFDIALDAGLVKSGKILQKAVASEQDGSVGPATLNAVKAVAPIDIIRRMLQLRLEFYRNDETRAATASEWTRRTNEIEEEAFKMASELRQAAT
jgi:hypothetical protein